MPLKVVLDKIVERHPGIIGAIVSHNGEIHHNLEQPYDMVPVDDVMSTCAEIFEQTKVLGDQGLQFDEMLMEFPSHTIIFRSLDDALMAVLAPDLPKGQIAKLQVSLGPFSKAVLAALREEQPVEKVAVTPQKDEEQPVSIANEPDASIVEEGRPFMQRPKSRSRSRSLPNTFVQEAPDAITSVTSKHEMHAGSAQTASLRDDGTPKVKRVYRGTTYYE